MGDFAFGGVAFRFLAPFGGGNRKNVLFGGWQLITANLGGGNHSQTTEFRVGLLEKGTCLSEAFSDQIKAPKAPKMKNNTGFYGK